MNRAMSPVSSGLLCLFLLSTVAASPLLAQRATGGLYGSVTEASGERLAGAVVELDGMGAPRQQTADSAGSFRFLGLDPGRYALRASLDGYSTVERQTVTIEASRNTTLEVELTRAVNEVLTVTGESPLLDERKLVSGTSVTRLELEAIPTARDPWAIMHQTPGVWVNQVNVGGGQSGQQPGFRGLGVSMTENDWNMDGVQISDMTFVGASPTYYDFDQFEEIQITTGGNDITRVTGGVAVNMVTRRGTNQFRGSARFLMTDGAGYFGVLEEADSGFDPGKLGPGQEGFVPNRIDRIEDLGFEAGGPAWRDRLWFWAAWGQTDINRITGSGQNDRTVLENAVIKVNAQIVDANSFVGSYNSGTKYKWGRGAEPSVDSSATHDQRGPTGVTKLEDTHVFGSNLFLSGRYSFLDGGYALSAQGGCGPDQPAVPFPGGEANVDENDYITNNDCGYNRQPAGEWRLSGSVFLAGWGLSHELEFGGRSRDSQIRSKWTYPGRALFHVHGVVAGVQDEELLESLGLPPERVRDAHMVEAQRSGESSTTGYYRSLWFQDTMTRGRWTANLGLRYDDQYGRTDPRTVEANPAFPGLMPSVSVPGNDSDGMHWSDFSPRLGLTYALGEERQTLVRASFAQFIDALGLGDIGRTDPASDDAYGYIVFLDEPGGFAGFYDDGEQWAVDGVEGFDPDDPTALPAPVSRNDSNMNVPLTRELILGVEHSFLPELVTGLRLTWRNRTRTREVPPLFVDNLTGEVTTIPASEYVPDRVLEGSLPDGSPYAVPTLAANPARWTYTGGDLLTDGDREVDYFGAAITVTKRLSDQWMLRGFLNYNFDESWDVPASYFNRNDPNLWVQQDEGGTVTDGEIYAVWGEEQSTWQWNVNGMYQFAPDRPWGFNVAANLGGHQGNPFPYNEYVAGLDGVEREILVLDGLGDVRADDVTILDLRLEKEFAATAGVGFTFSIDGFNILNDGSVLNRYRNMASGNAGWVAEVVSPRVWRLGVRMSWR